MGTAQLQRRHVPAPSKMMQLEAAAAQVLAVHASGSCKVLGLTTGS